MTARVLVGCPNYSGKQYALFDWAKAFWRLDYPHEARIAYMVDNTRADMPLESEAFCREVRSYGIHCDHLDPVGDFDLTFYECWKRMLAKARGAECTRIFSVEADNIVPTESLTVMSEVMDLTGAAFVLMPYRAQVRIKHLEDEPIWYSELGCMLLDTEFLGRALDDWDRYANVSVAIFQTAARSDPPEGYVRLTPKLFEVEHHDGVVPSFQNLPMSRNFLTARPQWAT